MLDMVINLTYRKKMYRSESNVLDFKIIIFCLKLLFPCALIAFVYFSFCAPYLNVWQESMRGKAELARAESNRQIATLEALAVKESSKALSDAEVIRAQGVADANRIIGDSLTGNEGYLRYLWIQGLQTNVSKSVVYIPTEANLPIMEAGRWKEEERKP